MKHEMRFLLQKKTRVEIMRRKEFGERIEAIRVEKNLTRDQLAIRAGLSSKFIYEIEKGRKGLSVDSLMKLAQGLSCSYDKILDTEGIDDKKCLP